MQEKGKGKHIEHLQENTLDDSQYTLPGMTCNSAVWSKVLFQDIMCQTLANGILTDYDTLAAFDRVLHSMSIITCQCLGLPMPTCMFLCNLLQNMEFQLSTGFGLSARTFLNNEDPPQIGQGVLQGTSSAPPIYNINCDVSLTTYNQLFKGAQFQHPITGDVFTDHVTQYVDDKGEMLNSKGANIGTHQSKATQHEQLFQAANHNTDLWTQLLWIQYKSNNKAPGKIFRYNPATKAYASN